MSGLELEFREPYPVYRTLRVPVWEDGKPVNVRRVVDEDREAFLRALGKLRGLLEKVARMASDLGLSEDEKLWLAADAVAVFLKAPLVQEVSPVAPTPLKAHALALLAPRLRRKLWSQDLYEFAERLAGLTAGELKLAEELFDPETAKLVFRLWIAFPADTRPGYNASSLVAHALMTSAIAWALAFGRGVGEEAVVRLAALLHDLGKAVDPERHVEASEKLARQLLRGIIGNAALEALAAAIREHHRRAPVLGEADRLAASADRLRELVDEVIGDKIGRMEQLLGGSRDEWGFWRRVHERRKELIERGLAREDPLRELAEEFLRGVGAAARRIKGSEDPRLSLVLIDVASIQSFVGRSQEVRVVAAASHLIELAVHAHFLEFLRDRGLRVPPEAVLYAGGGNVLMLLPSDKVGDVERLAAEYGELTKLSLAVSATPFVDYYPTASANLFRGIFAKKNRVEPLASLNSLVESGKELCRMCYSDWATEDLETPEGKVRVCETCGKLYRVGSEMHFKPKWGARVRVADDEFSAEEAFGCGWDEVSKWIMEVIAGWDPEEQVAERMRDYAVVKFDGNAMGSFMLEAVSFTDAIERSFRIDVAVKRAYFKALEALYSGVKRAGGAGAARKEVARVFLGAIYMGGDDGFLLAPSWAAVPLAHFIAEEFARQLGLERGLKVGVAAGPARMSLWALLDCASELMGEAGRVLRGLDPTARSEVLSAVAFDIFESGSPSGASAVERMKRFSRRARQAQGRDESIDGMQPYLIRRRDLEGQGAPEFWSALAPLIVGSSASVWSDTESFRMHSELLRKAYLASRAEETDEREELKNLRNAILRSWSAVSPSLYWRERLLVYLLRQRARREERGEEAPTEREAGILEAYARLARFVSLSLERGPVPLADALTLIKFLKGGAW